MRTKEIRPFYPGGVPDGGSGLPPDPPPLPDFPDDITGLWSRLDASDTDSITAEPNNDLTRWTDISGNGRDAFFPDNNPLNSTPPKTGQATVNEQNALSFDGNLVQVLTSPGRNYRDRTYFAVVNKSSQGGAILGTFFNAPEAFLGFDASNGSLGGAGAELRCNGSNPYIPEGAGGSVFAGLPADHNATNVLGWVFGDPLKLTVNGQIGPNTPSRFTQGSQSIGRIGAQWIMGNELVYPFTGNICEIVIYDRVLTDEEVGRVNEYLIEKWGAG